MRMIATALAIAAVVMLTLTTTSPQISARSIRPSSHIATVISNSSFAFAKAQRHRWRPCHGHRYTGSASVSGGIGVSVAIEGMRHHRHRLPRLRPRQSHRHCPLRPRGGASALHIAKNSLLAQRVCGPDQEQGLSDKLSPPWGAALSLLMRECMPGCARTVIKPTEMTTGAHDCGVMWEVCISRLR